MVQVGDSQHHPATILADGIVLNAAELAAVMCPLKDACTDLLPVLGISGFILWFYWHIADGAELESATPVGLKAVAHTTPDALPLSYPSKNRCGVLCLSYHKTHLRPTTAWKSDSLLPRRADSDRHFRTDAPPLVHSLAITPWAVAG